MMKKFSFLIIGLFCIFKILHGQESVTYQIEKLEKPAKLLTKVAPEKLFSKYENNLLRISVTDSLVDKGTHTVLAGFLQAYQEHRPVTLSPDIIWLLICQGFAHHVNNNAEQLRNKFVGFEGKKELQVVGEKSDGKIDDFPWEIVFPKFVQQINAYTGKELMDVLTADFTTSTPSSIIASQITVMQSMEKYFKYKVIMIGCGIPSVTIEGSIQNWEKILQRLEGLAQYDLKWWTDKVKPIINEIIKTKKGEFDKDFWMNMVRYHKKGLYGSVKNIDGWLLKFYPYLKNKARSDMKAIDNLELLPDELVCVPFIFCDDIHKKTYQMEFWAGFMGLKQNSKTMELKPEIGWAVNKLDK